METLRAACQRLLAELAVDLHASYALVERDAGGRDASSIPHRRAPDLRPGAGESDPDLAVTYGTLPAAGEGVTWLDLPVHEGWTEMGRLRLGFAAGVEPPHVDQVRMAHSLLELAVLLGHARWEQALSSSQASRRILAVTEDELQRIILDIHDGPVQKLFVASSQIAVLQSRLAQLPEDVRSRLEPELVRIGDLVQTSLGEIKTTLGALRPPEFRRRPLGSVIHGLIMQHEALTGAQVELQVVNELPHVSLPVKIAVYRILQEALSNAYRHAGVDRMDVRLSSEDGWVILEVSDKGRGFDPPPLEGPSATEREEHIGLRGMRERAQLVNGQLTLTSHPGQGTKIQVRVPVDV